MSWAGDAWSPPRILVGSYQVPGKVAEGLHPVEVALLMELPLPRVAAMGPGTAEALARFGLRADLLPEQCRAEALAAGIEDLYQSPERRAAMAAAGARWVEQFDAPRVAHRFLEACAEVSSTR